MGLLDSLRGLFKPAPAMRDRHADREAGKDPKLGSDTPSGSVGPGGSVLEGSQGAGGAIEPDPPRDQG
ncbi:MAG TPA: hypothetical protein VGC98_16520 [Thermoleophilaceae bacterium]